MAGRKHRILPKIDRRIERAWTLPGKAYQSESLFNLIRERVFLPSWQWIGTDSDLPANEEISPVALLPGMLDEPLLYSRDKDGILHLLSNVCTHRGNLLCHKAQKCREIRCGYHGRRFKLDGSFKHMPHTAGMEDFPSECDNLPSVRYQDWHGLIFATLNEEADFSAWISGMLPWIHFLPLDRMKHDPSRSKSYHIAANWALYCDNYLEGFHIPFVHPGLTQTLDVAQYETHVLKGGVLQTGIAKESEPAFDLPETSSDFGKRVGAYYFWLFPNIMFNFYPWGLSLNVVYPQSVDRTRVDFHSYVWDESKLDKGAGNDLDKVEMEDEAIVMSVQKGVGARLYTRGRFSPAMEQGVHHFHRLLTQSINAGK